MTSNKTDQLSIFNRREVFCGGVVLGFALGVLFLLVTRLFF